MLLSPLHPTAYHTALGSKDGSYAGFVETYGAVEIEQCHDLFLNPYGFTYGPDVDYQQIVIEDVGLCMRDHTTDVLAENPPNAFVLDRAIITGDNIRFGLLKIGVGSPKWCVRLAYLFADAMTAEERYVLPKLYPQKVPPDPSIFALGYQGKTVRIFFQFDTNNHVHSIMIDF